MNPVASMARKAAYRRTWGAKRPARLPGHLLSVAAEDVYWKILKPAMTVWARENGFDTLDARQREAAREYFHTRALAGGANKSLKEFALADLDRVLAYLRAYGRGGHVAAAFVDLDKAEEDGHRQRLLWRVQRWSGHGSYIADLTHGRTRDPESLTTEELEHVAITASERMRGNHRRDAECAETETSPRSPRLSGEPDPFAIGETPF